MSLSMYQVSVPAFVRGLQVMATLLRKAEAHADEHGMVHDVLLGARLYEDMMPLTAQVQRASDTAKLAVERLTGVASPKFPDDEASFPQLQERIANTISYLESVSGESFAGSEAKEVVLNYGTFQPKFTGEGYLQTFALPNFYFHVTTLYGILRNQGVKLGKMDYLGPYTPL